MSDFAESTRNEGLIETPSRVRYSVLSLLCGLAFILYIDRICIGQAGQKMMEELQITKTMWGFVLGAFTLSYMLFEVITGHWGDRYGSRGVLVRIVLWWSAFTALTGCVYATYWSSPAWWYLPALNGGFLLLVLVRFLFGAGEAGALPNVARVIGAWFPAHSRGSAQGAIVTATLVGGATAPLATGLMIQTIGWRSSFAVFGALGVVWCVVFALLFRDRPEDHPGVNEAELELIRLGRTAQHAEHPPIPWGRILTSANLWLMGGLMNCGAAVFYMLFSWYATYLKEARGLGETMSGFQMSLIMAAGACGCLSGGYLSDFMIRIVGSRRAACRLIGCASYLMAAGFFTASVLMKDPFHSSLCVAISHFFLQLQIPSWWGVVTEISGPHVGAMFGLMNSMGGIGAFWSPALLGMLTDYQKRRGVVGRMQWDPGFYAYAGLMLVGACLWLLINPARSLVEDTSEVALRD